MADVVHSRDFQLAKHTVTRNSVLRSKHEQKRIKKPTHWGTNSENWCHWEDLFGKTTPLKNNMGALSPQNRQVLIVLMNVSLLCCLFVVSYLFGITRDCRREVSLRIPGNATGILETFQKCPGHLLDISRPFRRIHRNFLPCHQLRSPRKPQTKSVNFVRLLRIMWFHNVL